MVFKKRALSRMVAIGVAGSVWGASANQLEAPRNESVATELEEIVIVSSTRTGTDLTKTAAAVTALSAATLSDQAITNPTALAELTPNLSIDRANGLQITIRGVSSTDNTEKGDPSAAFLLDGVYIARAQAQEVSFFDLAQVEILRGPQGTLYGRNATAGLINVISARPDSEKLTGFIDATAGNFSSQQLTGVLNVPVLESSAIRLAINADRRDSFLNRDPDSDRDVERAKDNLSFRLSGLFDLSDSAEIFLMADHSSLKGSNRADVKLSTFFDIDVGEGGVVENVDNISDDSTSDELTTTGYIDLADPDYDNSTWGIMSELNWSLSDVLTFTYVGSYREFERREDYTGFTGTVAGGAIDILGPRLFTGDYEQHSNEFRLTNSSEGFRSSLFGAETYSCTISFPGNCPVFFTSTDNSIRFSKRLSLSTRLL